MLSLFSPQIVDYLSKPKIALKVEKVQFEKKTFGEVEGYQLKASVKNCGKKICVNLDASFEIKDMKGQPPRLLYATVEKADGHATKISSREEPMRYVEYGWVNKKERIHRGVFKELRKNDLVGLVFPYETSSVGAGAILNGGFWRSTSSECLLKLDTDTYYQVYVEVKGEDSQKNTVIKTKKEKMGHILELV